MRRKLFKTLCFVSTVANLLGCSTTRVQERKRERIEVCVPDPRNDSLQCALPDRTAQTRPFQTLPIGKYICFPVDPITRILGDE